MKKRILALLLAATMALGMVACGGKTDDNQGSVNSGSENAGDQGSENAGTASVYSNFTVPEGGYDGSEVTIKFYHTMGSNLQTVLNLYIEEFNKLYPNIHIESTSVGGYDDVRDQISTEITVGNQPNIAYCYPDHVALYNLAKAVTTLDG